MVVITSYSIHYTKLYEVEILRNTARRNAKRVGMRHWSPTLYEPGAKRGGENIVSYSCLVMDYDSGFPIEEASEQWSSYNFV